MIQFGNLCLSINFSIFLNCQFGKEYRKRERTDIKKQTQWEKTYNSRGNSTEEEKRKTKIKEETINIITNRKY